MKNCLSAFTLLLVTTISFGQQQFDRDAALAFRKQLNAAYAAKESSPLTSKDLASFKGLSFFAPDAKYAVVAKFVRTAYERPFEMPTSTKRKAMYQKYGEATFTLDGKTYKLNIYQSLEGMQSEAYKDHLFLPFTDLTSGKESYGGGRYIDLKIPAANTILIDFNKAYNPYCAYNAGYSCPIPPRENHLKTAIRAGVKKFH